MWCETNTTIAYITIWICPTLSFNFSVAGLLLSSLVHKVKQKLLCVTISTTILCKMDENKTEIKLSQRTSFWAFCTGFSWCMEPEAIKRNIELNVCKWRRCNRELSHSVSGAARLAASFRNILHRYSHPSTFNTQQMRLFTSVCWRPFAASRSLSP